MIRTRRLAMLTPLLVSALALGPAVAAHGATGHAPAAPTKPRCLLTEDSTHSKPDDPRFTLSASGFKSDAVSFSGGNGSGGAKTANGSFSVGNLKPGHYIARSKKDGEVNCGRTPGEKGGKKSEARAQYAKGFSAGFKLIKKDCKAKPPHGLNKSTKDYEAGFKDGAALAADQFC
ncbi:hypothetical protein ACFV0T_35065 [Streptomyces sp. NPDC059582]|uniref:hypothetical protein n=1 Tax=Streptomyces sp. NPDC059582 TaxID=3346875 RepID=UPI0036C84D44